MKRYLISLICEEWEEIHAKNKKDARKKAQRIIDKDFLYEFRIDTIEEIKK